MAKGNALSNEKVLVVVVVEMDAEQHQPMKKVTKGNALPHEKVLVAVVVMDAEQHEPMKKVAKKRP